MELDLYSILPPRRLILVPFGCRFRLEYYYHKLGWLSYLTVCNLKYRNRMLNIDIEQSTEPHNIMWNRNIDNRRCFRNPKNISKAVERYCTCFIDMVGRLWKMVSQTSNVRLWLFSTVHWKGWAVMSNGWSNVKHLASNKNHTVSAKPINFQHSLVYWKIYTQRWGLSKKSKVFEFKNPIPNKTPPKKTTYKF